MKMRFGKKNMTMPKNASYLEPGPLEPLFIAMILDKSGSMKTLSQSTVDGFNEYLGVQRRDAKDARMSVTLFDDKIIKLHEDVSVLEIPDLTVATYQHGEMGRTALYEAIGRTVTGMEHSPHVAGRRVLVVIMTDGQNNINGEWTCEAVAELQREKEALGWKFVFFGQNPMAMAESQNMGMRMTRSAVVAPTAMGTRTAYHNLTEATSLYAAGATDATWESALHNGSGDSDLQDSYWGTNTDKGLRRGVVRRYRDDVPYAGDKWNGTRGGPGCTCNQPLMLVIPPGGSAEVTCPIHGAQIIRNGVEITL